MSSQNSKSTHQMLKNQHVTLLELLDRLIDKGVMAKGEILLSVADVDLVYLNLGLLLSSVKTVEHAASRGSRGETVAFVQQTASRETLMDEQRPETRGKEADFSKQTLSLEDETDSPDSSDPGASTHIPEYGESIPAPSSASNFDHVPSVAPRTNVDPKHVEQGLAKLVLTLVDLIRKLMEKQAIRRIEDGQLSVEEIEEMGNAFLLLDEKMKQLKEIFGLEDEDLNLDLGPLGELL